MQRRFAARPLLLPRETPSGGTRSISGPFTLTLTRPSAAAVQAPQSEDMLLGDSAPDSEKEVQAEGALSAARGPAHYTIMNCITR